MKAWSGRSSRVSFARITQLVNKTNQFNLTTRRSAGTEVERADDQPVGLHPHGPAAPIGSAITGLSASSSAVSKRHAHVDGWLMSCRVLGRGVERLLFNDVLTAARARGLAHIVGEYRPTDRNRLVKDLYAGLGFSRDGGEGTTERWRLRVADAVTFDTCIAGHRATCESPTG